MVRAVSNEALTVEDTDDNERMCHVMVCSRRQIFQISRSFGRTRALLGLVAMGAGFLAARRVAVADATIAAVAAATAVCGACIVARALCPAAFAPAAAAAWWLAAIAACTFAAAEARAWLRAAAVAFVDAPVSARLVR